MISHFEVPEIVFDLMDPFFDFVLRIEGADVCQSACFIIAHAATEASKRVHRDHFVESLLIQALFGLQSSLGIRQYLNCSLAIGVDAYLLPSQPPLVQVDRNCLKSPLGSYHTNQTEIRVYVVVVDPRATPFVRCITLHGMYF